MSSRGGVSEWRGRSQHEAGTESLSGRGGVQWVAGAEFVSGGTESACGGRRVSELQVQSEHAAGAESWGRGGVSMRRGWGQ